ncbi:MAG: CatB-related O-acetyltransferase [Eubacteriaceae bacterium]
MKINKIVPGFIKEYILLMKLRVRFPNCKIYSYLIGSSSKIGNKVIIMHNSVIHNNCIIEDYSYINTNTVVGYAHIGKFCSIGCNCQIGIHNHPINYVSTSPYTYGKDNIFDEPSFYEDFQNKTIVGNDCWIGSNVIIMQGVKIGDGAIIAAGSVVTKNVEPYGIVAGVPSKLINKRFDQPEIDYLLKLKWWDMDIDNIKKYKDMFINKENWFSFIKSTNLCDK